MKRPSRQKNASAVQNVPGRRRNTESLELAKARRTYSFLDVQQLSPDGQ